CERAPEQQREDHDHEDPPNELGRGELPGDQDGEQDAELDHEVRRGELEGHRRGEVGAAAEERSCEGDGRVGARRGRCAEAARDRERAGRVVGEEARDLALRDDRLDDAREREAEDQRPQDDPRHAGRDRQGVCDRVDHGRLAPVMPPTIPPGGTEGYRGPNGSSPSTVVRRRVVPYPEGMRAADPPSDPGRKEMSMADDDEIARPSAAQVAALSARSLWWFALIWVRVRRRPLPD